MKENESIRKEGSRRDPERYISDIEKYAGKGRIWVIISHNCFWCPVNEEKFIVQTLSDRATLRDAFRALDASAYLYDFSLKKR